MRKATQTNGGEDGRKDYVLITYDEMTNESKYKNIKDSEIHFFVLAILM